MPPHDALQLSARLRPLLEARIARVKRPAEGALRHDYLVPGGPYPEQWDWDAFFIGMAIASRDRADAVYLRNWGLNYIENARDDGFCPGLLTPKGPDWRLKHMKPFLAQGCLHASRFLNDSAWLTGDLYARLKRIVLYREEHGLFHVGLGLFAWTDSMESGADNNLAALEYPDGSVAAVDCSCFVYAEYAATALIARNAGQEKDSLMFRAKAEHLREAIIARLWNREDGAYENIDTRTGEFIRVVGYSSVHPLWAGIAPQEQADAFIDRWLLHPDKLRSPHGIRTLSKDHPRYNNANIIKPHSNWQGPVWPIAMVLYAQSLANYGRTDAALDVAADAMRLCLNDIEKSGGMHENYDAETGQPLAAPDFISWNLLLMNLAEEVQERRNPFMIRL
ncbi:MAG: alpha,alpha-trehalase [Candidatus Peregrinibacteria bacterium Gr01-1014_25]|nr:MAG: alpha,alpha-trehalase [Candidatus Peregrinibacteria bacterium Gr01-1014_25]